MTFASRSSFSVRASSLSQRTVSSLSRGSSALDVVPGAVEQDAHPHPAPRRGDHRGQRQVRRLLHAAAVFFPHQSGAEFCSTKRLVFAELIRPRYRAFSARQLSGHATSSRPTFPSRAAAGGAARSDPAPSRGACERRLLERKAPVVRGIRVRSRRGPCAASARGPRPTPAQLRARLLRAHVHHPPAVAVRSGRQGGRCSRSSPSPSTTSSPSMTRYFE